MDVFSTREDSRAREDVLYSYLNKNRWRMMTDRLEFFMNSVAEEEHDRDAVFVADRWIFSVTNLSDRRLVVLVFGERFGLGRRLIDHRDDYHLVKD